MHLKEYILSGIRKFNIYRALYAAEVWQITSNIGVCYGWFYTILSFETHPIRIGIPCEGKLWPRWLLHFLPIKMNFVSNVSLFNKEAPPYGTRQVLSARRNIRLFENIKKRKIFLCFGHI